jgi:hypothetical protein
MMPLHLFREYHLMVPSKTDSSVLAAMLLWKAWQSRLKYLANHNNEPPSNTVRVGLAQTARIAAV